MRRDDLVLEQRNAPAHGAVVEIGGAWRHAWQGIEKHKVSKAPSPKDHVPFGVEVAQESAGTFVELLVKDRIILSDSQRLLLSDRPIPKRWDRAQPSAPTE